MAGSSPHWAVGPNSVKSTVTQDLEPLPWTNQAHLRNVIGLSKRDHIEKHTLVEYTTDTLIPKAAPGRVDQYPVAAAGALQGGGVTKNVAYHLARLAFRREAHDGLQGHAQARRRSRAIWPATSKREGSEWCKGCVHGGPVSWRVNGTRARHHLGLESDGTRQNAPAPREDVDLLNVSLLARDAQIVENGGDVDVLHGRPLTFRAPRPYPA